MYFRVLWIMRRQQFKSTVLVRLMYQVVVISLGNAFSVNPSKGWVYRWQRALHIDLVSDCVGRQARGPHPAPLS